MAWTTADLDALKKAIASGQVEVQYADKRIKYQSTDSMLKAMREIEADLTGQGLLTRPANARPDVSVVLYSRD